MSVIQISKIQVRRGQKNSNSGIPQLSSAEFAWAVDSQELYIGNGSVAEGAPYVGNTKILTEHDNILDLASSYTFGSGSNASDLHVIGTATRTLQGKIDEIQVSVVDFGASGDGVTDNSDAFEAASLHLFSENVTDVRYKKVLIVPNGNYVFERGFALYSGTIIRGETKYGAVLDIGANNVRFITADGLELPEFDSGNRPTKINISNISFKRTTGSLTLSGISDSVFEDILFVGDANLTAPYVEPTVTIQSILNNVITTITNAHSLVAGDAFVPQITSSNLVQGTKYYIKSVPASNQFTVSETPTGAEKTLVNGGSPTVSLEIVGTVISNIVSPLVTTPAAVFWQNTSFGTSVNDITFRSCEFNSNVISVKCLQSDIFDSEVFFDTCTFSLNDTAIYINGAAGQGNRWIIQDCKFIEISKQAFRSTNGTNTLIKRSTFKECGNGYTGGTIGSGNPSYVIVYFGEKIGNTVLDCTFDRIQAAGITTIENTAAISEVYNASKVELVSRNYSPVYYKAGFSPLAVLSAHNNYFVINYTLKLGEHSRTGQLALSINDSLTSVAISDHYQYSPLLISGSSGQVVTAFEFDAQLKNNNADSGSDTVVLYYKNPLGTDGTISFDIAYGV